MGPIDIGPEGEKVDQLLERLRGYAELGVVHVHGWLADVATIRPIEMMGERVIPAAAAI
jgi:alkanesulfonate monooxygenase